MGIVHYLPFGKKVPLVTRERVGVRSDEGNLALVEIGLFNTGELFIFKCPTCGKQEVNDQRMELACTGPSWTNEHPMVPMIYIGTKPKEARIIVPRGIRSD